MLVTLSLTVLTGGWAVAGNVVTVLRGILSGAFYAASAPNRR
jgi:hypothetical protein